MPPLLLQVLRRLVQCGGWKISACRGAQALTEVCDSQQTRPVLHCAAASLHLLQDEARRAARHIGECATAKAPVAIGLMVFARRVWTSLETTRALFGSAFNRPFSCRPAPPAWPPGGRADARSEIAKCLSITLRGWSPSSQRCNPHGQAATSAGVLLFAKLGKSTGSVYWWGLSTLVVRNCLVHTPLLIFRVRVETRLAECCEPGDACVVCVCAAGGSPT